MKERTMSLWNRMRLVVLFLRLLLNPNRTDLIFRGVEILTESPELGPIRSIEEKVMAHREFAGMFERQYVPQAPSFDFLAACPAGSFGEAVYQHMGRNGFDFSLWPTYENKRPIQYLSTRIYQDHDLWHPLLGFGVSVEDELAIQAFGVAQFNSAVGLLLIAGGLLRLIVKDPVRAVEAFGVINEQYALGKRAPFLLATKLHDLLPQPLNEVRKTCGLI